MDKVKSCLKGFYIFFNVLLGLAGCGLLIRTQMSLQYADLRIFHSVSNGIFWIHGFAGAMILLCGLGVWGAYKERNCILGIYIGGTVIGVILLLFLGIRISQAAPMIRSIIIDNLDGLQRAMKSNMEVQRHVMIIELQFECCGLNHYADWGSNVPQSCQCPSQYQNTDRCTTVIVPFDYDSSYMFYNLTERNIMEIYSKPCGPKVVHYVELALNIFLGQTFGFAAFEFLLLLLTFAMLCVIKKKDEAVRVMEEALPISLDQYPRFWLYPQVPNQVPNITFNPPPYSLLSAHPMPGSPIQNSVCMTHGFQPTLF